MSGPCDICRVPLAKPTLVATYEARYQLDLCAHCRVELRKQWKYEPDRMTARMALEFQHRKVLFTQGVKRKQVMKPRRRHQLSAKALRQQEQVITMRGEGMTFQQIADQLKIPKATATSRAYYYRQKQKEQS